MQENIHVGTSLTIKQFPNAIDSKVHAQKEKEQSDFKQVPPSGSDFPGAQAYKASEEGGLGLPGIGD